MKQKLIDKSALVAEIERRIADVTDECNKSNRPQFTLYGKIIALDNLLSFINTLEVKEVDLEAETRMKECPFRQIGCTMYEGKVLECTGACSWVVDYQKIKELKAKNGRTEL